jgi:hypothetical protein
MTETWRKLTKSLVLQFFWDDNVLVVKNAVVPDGSSLSAQTYNSLTDVQKLITLRPFIISVRINNRSKEERVVYNYCIGLLIRFLTRQCQNWIFWLLLVVEADLHRCQKFSFWSFLGEFKDGHLSWCFNIMMGHLPYFCWSFLECYTFGSPIAWGKP